MTHTGGVCSLMMMRPDMLMNRYKGSAPFLTINDGEKTVAVPLMRIALTR